MQTARICSDTIGESRYSRTALRLGRYCAVMLFLVLLFAEVQAQTGVWKKKVPLPSIRAGASACVVNGKIYVFGGCDGAPNFADMVCAEVYDPLTDSWVAKASMPTARGWLSTALVNDTIYAIGGGYPVSKSVVEAYDPGTNMWTRKKDLLAPRRGAQAGVVNGIIYNVGGNQTERTCEAYDPLTDTWIRKQERPESGGNLSVTVYNGLLYTFGGGMNSTSYANVYAYDPKTDGWSKKRDMPTPRYGLQTYLVNGKIYAIGGSQTQNTSLATVEGYDPATDTWETLPNMPENLVFPAGAVVDGKIYVIGGTPDWAGGGLYVWECVFIVGGVAHSSESPEDFVLEQNYPNPFNPATVIKYTIGGTRDQGSGARNVKLAVFDLLGHEVAVLVNEKKAPGSYEVRFDGTGLSSGVYMCRLTAGHDVEARTMLLLR